MSNWLRIRCRQASIKAAFSLSRKQLLARSLTPGFFAYNVNTTGYHEAVTNAPTVSNLKTAIESFEGAFSNRNFESDVTHSLSSHFRSANSLPRARQAYTRPYVISYLKMSKPPPLSTMQPMAFGKKLHVDRIPLWLRHTENLRLFHRYYSNMPHLPHRPTKAEVLAQARGFFERLRVRIRFILMRSMRPWTLNDIGAVFSWVFLGQTVWLLVGTTSFVSLILWTANSLQFQGKQFCFKLSTFLSISFKFQS
jgi:hypothetical protein